MSIMLMYYCHAHANIGSISVSFHMCSGSVVVVVPVSRIVLQKSIESNDKFKVNVLLAISKLKYSLTSG